MFKKKIGDTIYGIGWLPLGGYVKISGMIDESMDTELMKEEPKPWEFRSKPSWQRLIIMLGGVTVNFILAVVIYILMAFVYGSADIDAKSVVGGYEISNPVLNEIGLETGDKIVSINGEEIEFVSEIRPKLIEAKTVKIERDGNLRTLNFPVDFPWPEYSGAKKPNLFLFAKLRKALGLAPCKSDINPCKKTI